MNCPNCGTEMSTTAKFCSNCGSQQNTSFTSPNIPISKKKKSKWWIWVTVILLLAVLIPKSPRQSSNTTSAQTPEPTLQAVLAPKQTQEIKQTQAPTAAPKPTASISASRKNALRAAENYLNVMPFSKSGLVEQLEYEGYSTEDAEYASNTIGANWNEQAAKSAKKYLDIMPFSRSGLIEQLEFEGFTHDEAVYGVDQAGL